MPLSEINLPHKGNYDYGIGVDRLSGMAMNLVVNQTQSPPIAADGGDQTFTVARVSSTHDLQENLGIDVSGSYGCASFGAGISARFTFSQNSKIHSASLFMSISRTIHLADQNIDECVLTRTAAGVVAKPDIFTGTYGNMFLRTCKRGGLFVGLMQVQTFDEGEATSIEADLKGSYGLFSADAQTKFSKVTSDHNASVYCTFYAEGGPEIIINDPTDPKQLLDAANMWAKAFDDAPDRWAKYYEWTLSPVTIAEGPIPLNAADIEHAQDVLTFCAQQRAALFDQLNLLDWWVQYQDRYDWTGAATPQQVAKAAAAFQSDLDTVAACASAAMDSPKDAVMPADYATAQGRRYPLGQVPTPAPKAKPGAAPVTPAAPISTPNFIGKHLDEARLIAKAANVTLDEGDLREFLETYTDRDGTLHQAESPSAVTITAQDPDPGHLIQSGDSVQLEGRP